MSPNSQNSIVSYMRDIHNFSLVSPKEEKELARRIEKGDEKANMQLVTANLRLVVKIAHSYKGFGLPLQDLIAEGNIGLMRAVEKFDASKNLRFATYATWWIKQAIRRALADKNRTVRIPVAAARKLKKIQSVRSQLREQLGRDPDDKELSLESGISTAAIFRLRHVEMKTASINSPISSEGNASLHDFIADKQSAKPDVILENKDCVERLNRLLKLLNKHEQVVLALRFGLLDESPKTLREVGNKIGRTSERVRQIEKNALVKLYSLFEKYYDADSVELLSRNLLN